MGKVERGVKMSGSEKVEDEDVRIHFFLFSQNNSFSVHIKQCP